jgi:hypothetical protein
MEFRTANGVEVKINMADFITSMKLKKSVVDALRDSDIDISSIDFNDIKSGAIDSIVQAILAADSSVEVEGALFKCLERCLYGNNKITRDTFEPVEAREDYYEIVIACLKVNLLPFFKPLLSKLDVLQAKKAPDSLEQK